MKNAGEHITSRKNKPHYLRRIVKNFALIEKPFEKTAQKPHAFW